MKKGRHRRFEEARKLKQSGPGAFDLGFGDRGRGTTTTHTRRGRGVRRPGREVRRRVRRRRRPTTTDDRLASAPDPSGDGGERRVGEGHPVRSLQLGDHAVVDLAAPTSSRSRRATSRTPARRRRTPRATRCTTSGSRRRPRPSRGASTPAAVSHVAVLVGRVLEPHRHLPAHVGLPVERPLAGLEGGDVQGAPGAAGEPGPVEEDAGVVDEAGHRRHDAAVARRDRRGAGTRPSPPWRGTASGRAQADERLDDVGDVVVVDEVGAVGAAALGSSGAGASRMPWHPAP